MSQKERKQKKKSIIFFVTLGITLFAGVLALVLFKLLDLGGMGQKEEAPVIAEIENADGMGESIRNGEEDAARGMGNAEAGEQGTVSGKKNAEAGEQGTVSGKKNAEAGEQGMTQGTGNAEAGEQDAVSGKEDAGDGENKGNGESGVSDDGLDADGCLRDENGRILVKKQETAGEEATLLFAGDILFDDSYAMMASLRQRGGDIRSCFSAETLKEMESADIFMLNNEFTYTDRGEPTPEKKFTFRAKPENAAFLSELGVDIVSLANNHTYDYGEVSLLDTLATLEGIDMPYVGAGRNLAEASEAVYFLAGNQKIAYLSATMIERLSTPDTKGATDSSPGVFRCFTEEGIFDKIKEVKEDSDFVVVYIHWGTEKVEEPDWSQPDMAAKLAAAGADLIIGDHPHILQKLAKVDGVPVVYSVGNYWFNSSTLNTCLVKVVLRDGEMQSFQFLPALQSGCYTKLLSGAEKEAVLELMRNISDTVEIDAEGYVTF